MRRSGLLIVVPAVGALLFTGLAPASASSGRDEASGKVLAIDDEATVSRNGKEVVVEFRYECKDGKGRNGDVEADVTLRNGGRYEADDVNLRCNGKRHWKSVRLERQGRGEVKKGDRATVTVTLSADRDELDRERQKVEIEKARRR